MTTHAKDQQLVSYRQTIDNLDAALLHILAERFRCTEKVGNLKAQQNMPASDEERERSQLERLTALATEIGLDEGFVQSLMKLIVGAVVERHIEIGAKI
ncbi:chorismate mutase [Brucella intermedia]|uniref:chorismate mutase n=1 Tax=Brucella intermedia TaxID=94625 RepID=UPI00124DF530|nr:chorismate mutase [Brucella intermedia]KAB2704389.1 chorismate mutase [Brucella intermedia]